MQEYKKSTMITVCKDGKMNLVSSDHFMINVMKRSLDLSGIAELRANLSRAVMGQRVAVQVNNTVLVGERTAANTAILITGYNKTTGEYNEKAV